jgi:tyrosyl-tRNA synthetase
MAIITDNQRIQDLLNRGCEEIIDRGDLEKKLKSGKKLRIKLGIDPTSPNLHIGRAIPLLKLRDFQELGHQIVFIIGDFTGIVGDTSDKDSERPMLDEKVVKENMKSYKEQAGKILDLKKCEIRHNSEWLDKLRYREIGKQANVFSVNEFIARDNIRKRLDAGKRVSLREVFYPLMQGYDSVAIEADVEIGGTDQKFNLLAGRELQRFSGQEPQNIITNPLIEGLDGRKMSSSWGNTINLMDSAREMYGKIMSLKDEFIIRYFVLTTRVDFKLIKQYEAELASGVNPRDIKIKLAYEMVRFYHGDKAAQAEVDYFVGTFSKKEMPTEMKSVKPSSYDIITFLLEAKAVSSKTDARRIIQQKGVKVNQVAIEDVNLELKKGDVVQKGKIFFARVA